MNHAITLGLCLAASTLLQAQDNQFAKMASSPSAFILAAGEHELRDVIKKAGAFLGRNYLFYPEEEAVALSSKVNRGRRRAPAAPAPGDESQHTFTLTKKLILDAIACEELVSQLAYSRGFLIVPIDELRGVFEVISLYGARARHATERLRYLSPKEVLRKSRMRIWISTCLPLKHLEATTAGQQLRSFVANRSNSGLIIGSVGASVLTIKGYADDVASVLRLIELIDVPKNSRNPSGNNFAAQLSVLRESLDRQHKALRALQSTVARLQAQLAKKRAKISKTSNKATRK